MYPDFFKRLIDFLVSLIALIILMPLLLIIALFLYISYRGNPFFYQIRPGKDEKLFTIIKFKTMSDVYGDDGNLLADDKRVTRTGKFIRKTSLDELPQLWNVLKGDMSLIGPRPLLVEYLSLYNNEQRKRHSVRPGITGWAQVNGRDKITWKKKFEYDLWYIENCSFFLDVKIMIKTIKEVVFSEAVQSKGEIRMNRFNGNN